jgi:hypothetical protein
MTIFALDCITKMDDEAFNRQEKKKMLTARSSVSIVYDGQPLTAYNSDPARQMQDAEGRRPQTWKK